MRTGYAPTVESASGLIARAPTAQPRARLSTLRGWRLLVEGRGFQLAAILCISVAARLIRLQMRELTGDEVFGLYAASLRFGEMLQFIALVDDHPPLFYAILWVWVRVGLGASELTLRLLPAILGVATSVLAYILGTRLLGRRVAFLAATLVALSPFLVRWSQEARMYSLLSVLSLYSLYALVRLLEEDRLRYWVGYGLAMVASLYTSYSAALSLLAYQVVAVWWWLGTRRPDPKRWLICHGLVLLGFAPWAFVEWEHGTREGAGIAWESSGAHLLWTLHRFISGPLEPHFPLLKGVVLVLGLLAAIGLWRALWGTGKRHRALFAVVGAALIPLSVGAIVELRGSPMISTLRWFIGVVVPVLFCVAAGIMHLPSRWRWAIVGTLLSLNLASLNRWVLADYPRAAGWQQVAARIASSSSGPSTLVVATPGVDAYVIEYYLRGYSKTISTFPYGAPRDLEIVGRSIQGKSEVWLSIRGEAGETILQRYLHEQLALKYTVEFLDSRLEKYEPR